MMIIRKCYAFVAYNFVPVRLACMILQIYMISTWNSVLHGSGGGCFSCWSMLYDTD